MNNLFKWVVVLGLLFSSGYVLAGGRTSPSAPSGVALTDTPTWTGAHTFSADVTFNGGVGAISLAAGETIVPSDGTLNVTGALVLSGGFETGLGEYVGTDGIYGLAAGSAQLDFAAGSLTLSPGAGAGNGFKSDVIHVDDFRIKSLGDFRFLDGAGNLLARLADDGATGSFSADTIAATTSLQGGALFASTGTFSALLTVNDRVLVDGSADAVQLTVQGNATQTASLFVAENNAGVDQFTVSNAGVVTALGDMSVADGFGFRNASDNAEVRMNTNSVDFYSGGALQVEIATTAVTIQDPVNFVGNGRIGAIAANATTYAGQLEIAHISGGGGLTTGAALGSGCGTSSAATQAGNDIGGSLGATCGTAGTTGNPFVTVTFADAYSTAPFCTISPANAATAAGVVLSQHIPVTTTTTLAVHCGGGVCTTGTLLWNYHCTQ